MYQISHKGANSTTAWISIGRYRSVNPELDHITATDDDCGRDEKHNCALSERGTI